MTTGMWPLQVRFGKRVCTGFRGCLKYGEARSVAALYNIVRDHGWYASDEVCCSALSDAQTENRVRAVLTLICPK